MAKAVYLLCAGTSLLCAGLLVKGYRKTRTRLLLWSCLGFVGLAASNVLLFLDMVVYTEVDLLPWRQATAIIGLMSLLLGFVWESR